MNRMNHQNKKVNDLFKGKIVEATEVKYKIVIDKNISTVQKVQK